MRRVHLSIHDVSPVFATEVEAALSLATAHGSKPALLVVPDYHGMAKLADHPGFCARLRELAAQGHEVFLHGLLHQASQTSDERRKLSQRAMLRELVAQRLVSGGEAEFADLNEEEAGRRLDEGATILRSVGLEPQGFVPPAWWMPVWLRSLLARRGYRYTEDHLRVYDPVAGRSCFSLLLNFATRSVARRWSTVVFCRTVRHAAGRWPTRIAIHPRDLGYPEVRQALRSLLAWANGRWACSAGELLG